MSVQRLNDSDGLTLYACTPTSTLGFAPFAIGFTVFSLSQYGGASSVSMNPVRILGPAIFANEWDYFYLYILGEFLGAGVAGLLVVYVIQSTSRDNI